MRFAAATAGLWGYVSMIRSVLSILSLMPHLEFHLLLCFCHLVAVVGGPPLAVSWVRIQLAVLPPLFVTSMQLKSGG